MRKGILLVVSGFAGSGKGTLMKELVKKYDNYALSVSATTRAPRPGEVDGKDYYFVTKERFEEMIANDELIEYAYYVGNYYGTPRAFVEKSLDLGDDIILEIETQGGLKIKKMFPDAVLMFIMPPSVDEIYNRLKKRGTETEEVIQQRMEKASQEATVVENYDYLMINDNLDKCVTSIHNIVQGSKRSIQRCPDIIDDVKKQFEEYFAKQK